MFGLDSPQAMGWTALKSYKHGLDSPLKTFHSEHIRAINWTCSSWPQRVATGKPWGHQVGNQVPYQWELVAHRTGLERALPLRGKEEQELRCFGETWGNYTANLAVLSLFLPSWITWPTTWATPLSWPEVLGSPTATSLNKWEGKWLQAGYVYFLGLDSLTSLTIGWIAFDGLDNPLWIGWIAWLA